MFWVNIFGEIQWPSRSPAILRPPCYEKPKSCEDVLEVEWDANVANIEEWYGHNMTAVRPFLQELWPPILFKYAFI